MNHGVPEPQAALDKVKIIENHDPLFDLRKIPRLTFRDTLGDETVPFLRETVAMMLSKALEAIPKEFNLHVTSALRNFDRQKVIWNTHYDRHKLENPHLGGAALRRKVNKYAAPFDHPAPPGHSTGAAVDVVLQRLDGSFVDLVPPFLSDWRLGHTWTTKIDPEVYKLRMTLVKAMLDAGFSNCRDEYWHYSWGDSGWAVRVGEKTCCYGVVADPEV